MKKTILLLCSIILLSCHTKKHIEHEKNEEQIVDQHNSMNSLDWNGSYTGILPCINCEGIETVVILNTDLSYTLQEKHQGKEEQFTSTSGQFSWGKSGQIITLDNKADQRYFVGENSLRKLDEKGEKFTGDRAPHYLLSKKSSDITENHWSLFAMDGQVIDFDEKKGKVPYFILRAGEGNVMYGHSGCNKISGTYELGEGQQLQISKLMSTKMACPNMDIEDRFTAVIAEIDNYSINGDTLTLQKAKMAPLAKFVKAYFY